MQQFRDRDAAVRLLSRHLRNDAQDPRFAAVVDACVDEFRRFRWPSPPPGAFALMIPQLYWAIKDDDLKAVEAFWKAATAFASTNILAGSLTASAGVGLLSAAFSVFRQVRAKGAYLTIDQCHVLAALKRAASPVVLGELSNQVDFSTEDLLRVLTSLEKVRCGDGSVVALVAKDSDDRWGSSGV